MKFPLTITKFLVVGMFLLGFVLPVSAEQVPQPYKSFNNNNVVDWWDEFEDTSHAVPVNIDKAGLTGHVYNGTVIDWWDEFDSDDIQLVSTNDKIGSKLPGFQWL